MKKIACLVLSTLLMALAFTACGDKGSSAPSTTSTTTPDDATPAGSAIDFDEDPYTIVVCYPVLSEAQPDLPLIQEAISEITLREINAVVEFEAVSLFSMANIYNLKASGQEKIDLMMLMPGSSYLTLFANNNMIQPIDEYIDTWGADLKAILGDTLQAGSFDGKLYAVPQNKDVAANGYGVSLPVELCKKYDIDIDTIKTLGDLEAAFEIIKANEPDMTIVAPEQSGSNLVTVLQGKLDGLGAKHVMLETADDGSLTVVAIAGSDSFMEAALVARDWYEKGYVSRDVAATQDSGSQLQWSGKVFATLTPAVGTARGNITNGMQVRHIFLEDIPNPVLRTTSDAQMSIWTIPTRCERPDKVAQFLNLAFAHDDLGNLFRYGIEGTHYEVMADGSVDLINTAGWQNNWYLLGDYSKILMRNDMLVSADVTLEEFVALEKEWNDTLVQTSPAYGFTFDPSAVSNEIGDCDAVMDEFGSAIGNGTVDPTVEIPKYLDRLEAAGLQTIIDEVQRQLDEWVAQQ